jgi:hypothetical protein
VTLTGPGGTGKTRLALQVAANLLGEFQDGVYFVALAAISEASLVLSTIVQTLGLLETPERPLINSVKDYLRDRRFLLVLDNFEHVAEAAPLIANRRPPGELPEAQDPGHQPGSSASVRRTRLLRTAARAAGARHVTAY